MGDYYSDDYKANNTYRLNYFDSQFETLSKRYADNQGWSLKKLWSQIKSVNSFKKVLQAVFSLDSSLANYVEGMSRRDFDLFFQRDLIQDIVSANSEGETQEVIENINIPVQVQSVNKKPREYFAGTVRGKRTIGYKDTVKIFSKQVVKYRDSKGRFIKVNL